MSEAKNDTIKRLVRCEECIHCVNTKSDGECTGCVHADYAPWWTTERIAEYGLPELVDKFTPNTSVMGGGTPTYHESTGCRNKSGGDK